MQELHASLQSPSLSPDFALEQGEVRSSV